MRKLTILLIVFMFLVSCSLETRNYTPTKSGLGAVDSRNSTSLPAVKTDSSTKKIDLPKRSELVVWNDKAMEKVVRNKLNKLTGEIYTSELDNITTLYLWGVTDKKIVSYNFDHSGNEYIDEAGQKYSDLGKITSIEDLKLFKNLKELTLCNQNIIDFSPLQSLIKLESLVLTNNGIEELSLFRPLKKLKTLIIDYNNISDLSGLDILDSLDYLDVSYNDISSLKGIDNCKALKTLYINQSIRRPKDLARVNDISYLGGLTCLENLSMKSQDTKDLKPLSGLLNLKSLNVEDNDIFDFTPLSNLQNLQSLKIKNYYINHNLAFLRNLPHLKDTDLSDDEWKKINYPFRLSETDTVEGIYPGNIVNGGFSGYDGKYVYYETIVYGDLGHPELERFNNETYTTESISGQITEQMGKMIAQDSGGMINENISFLNIYKGKLYFMGYGNNNDTADALEDGTYYPGDDVIGLARMNLDGSDRVMLTKDHFSYICVVNDRIYCLNGINQLVSMNLDGRGMQILLKNTCDMMYTDGKFIYYQLKNKDKKLYCMNLDGSQSKILLDTSCSQPIILGNEIYYLNDNGNICMFLIDKQQNNILFNCKANQFNLWGEHIFYSDENGIYRLDKTGQNLKQIYNGYAGSINVVGDYIFFDSSDGYSKIRNDGSEYTEYFEYF